MSCPNCFSGGVWEGHPTGKMVELHGLKTYVAEPEASVTPKGIIVFISDAFGPDFVNNRVLSDHYATRGFLVYCPDFMNGRAMSPSVIPSMHTVLEKSSWIHTVFVKPFLALYAMYHVIPWMMTCTPAKTEAGMLKFFKALRTSPSPFETKRLKIGAAGFCWGGKHTVTLAKDESRHRVGRHPSQTLSSSSDPEPLIDAAFVAHPTFIKVPDDIHPIRIPISWSVGEADLQMKRADIREVKSILENKKRGEHEVRLIPGAAHGFGNRTHPEDEVAMVAAERAEEQAVAWFSKWFA